MADAATSLRLRSGGGRVLLDHQVRTKLPPARALFEEDEGDAPAHGHADKGHRADGDGPDDQQGDVVDGDGPVRVTHPAPEGGVAVLAGRRDHERGGGRERECEQQRHREDACRGGPAEQIARTACRRQSAE
eukprot:scaffold22646_cov68-Phaeocystis_antarctica.AAC.10